MVMKIQRDGRLVAYENVVIEFIDQGGGFISFSDDVMFNRVLKDTVYKQLAVKKECVLTSSNRKYVLNVLGLKAKSRLRTILFTERAVGGKSNLDFIELATTTFAGIQVIVLTLEVDKRDLAILHEIGVDNIITKPLNINTLIEKIAFTVRPQGRIGQLVEKGKALVESADYPAAMQVADEILAIKPNSAAALMINGDAFKGQGKKDLAVAEYQKAHDSAKMYLEPLKRLASFYEDEGDNTTQLDYLSRLDQLSPLNVNRKVKIGGLYMELGQDEEGRKYFDAAVDVATREAAKNASSVAMDIAERLMATAPEAAEEYYRKALQIKGSNLDRSDVETFNRLGIALRRQKRPKAAVTEYQKALKIAPDDENLYYNMAMACLEGGELDMARENVDTALKLNPQFADFSEALSYNIGMVFFKNKDQDSANKYFRKALEIDPGYQPVLTMLGRARDKS